MLKPLSEMTTRELMALRDRCYEYGGKYSPYDNSGPFYHLEAVKDELSTREHVPNKTEAYEIRRHRQMGTQKRVLKYGR